MPCLIAFINNLGYSCEESIGSRHSFDAFSLKSCFLCYLLLSCSVLIIVFSCNFFSFTYKKKIKRPCSYLVHESRPLNQSIQVSNFETFSY
jgi:hypothetical protein